MNELIGVDFLQELEKLASRKLRINAKETMKIAEGLYTRGIISYPRTETNIFPNGLDLRPLVQQHTQDTNWGGMLGSEGSRVEYSLHFNYNYFLCSRMSLCLDFARRVLTEGPNPRNGKKSDQAHPPIHPTKHETGLQG